MKNITKLITIAFLFFNLLLSLCEWSGMGFCQNVGINQPTPDVSALLDLTSTNLGLLIPRIDLDDANTATPVTSPAIGLLIYNLGGDEPDGFYYWDGTKWVIFSSGEHYIGELYGGGIVFYVTNNGANGLIASLDDLDDAGDYSIQWDFNGTPAATGATSWWDGATNTSAIVALLGAGIYAAKLCDDYTGGTQTDWYLPAKDELKILYSVQDIINYVLNSDGNGLTNGFTAYYWSSTEYSASSAWIQSFYDGYQDYYNKINVYRVRAIRAF